jgi:excisionase family DNA binding protein
MDQDVSGWLTPNQAAKYLGVSRATLYRMCADGQVGYGTLPRSRRRRFRRADLDAILHLEGQPEGDRRD